MKTYDFINSHIGQDVYVTNDGDLFFESELRPVISYDTFKNATLVQLTKGGMAVVYFDNKYYNVPPKNVRLWGDDQMKERIKEQMKKELKSNGSITVISCSHIDVFKYKEVEPPQCESSITVKFHKIK